MPGAGSSADWLLTLFTGNNIGPYSKGKYWLMKSSLENWDQFFLVHDDWEKNGDAGEIRN